jgi:hypothetical protein
VDIPSPAPGGFSSSGPFFGPRPGVILVPAKTHALVGIGNGQGPPPYHGPPLVGAVFCLAVVVAAVLAIVNTVTHKG